MGESTGYTTFLLRVQQVPAGDEPGATTLRLILEDVRTGERRAFEGVAELFAFLATTKAKPDAH